MLGQELGGKQSISAKGSSCKDDPFAKEKGKVGSKDSEAQLKGSALKSGSKKLWNALLPPSYGCRQGGPSQCEPLTLERPLLASDDLPKEDSFEVGTQLDRCFSASPSRSSGFRKSCSGKGMSSTRGDADQRSLLKAHFLSNEKEKLCNFSKGEDRTGLKGFVGFPYRGSSVMAFPSYPITREK